jgi:cell division protein FtsB
MSGDRQDFLERQEARRRRMQQRLGQTPPSGRLPLPAEADDKTAGHQSKRQPQAARGKTGKAQSAGQAAKSRTPQPQAAEHLALPGDLDDLDDRSPGDGLKGRRVSAQRGRLAGRAVIPRGPKPPLRTRLIIWGTGAICGLLILATLGEVWTVHLLNQQIAANEQTNQQLQGQNQQLSNAVQQLQQASTIEQEARKLGFIFPGDQPVIVVTTTPQGTPPPQAAPPSQGWWGFWPDWFKLFFGG